MRQFLVLATILMVAASGCSGKGGSRDTSSSDEPTSSEPPLPTQSQEPNNTFVPKFHTHDYWSGRQSVMLFDGNLKIGQDPIAEFHDDANAVYVGHVEFDPKSDGDDGLATDKTDVVYQGTSRIDVTVTWTDSNIAGLKFSYKAANTPLFVLLGPVTSKETYSINLKPGMADMPHQLSLSRWRFQVDAFNPSTSSVPMSPSYANGQFHVTMKIINGGDRFIDPPHPYFFTHGPLRYAGEVNSTLSNCIIVNNTKNANAPQALSQPAAFQCPTATGADNYQPPPPAIMPWEATNALVDFYYNYTSPNGAAGDPVGHKLGLKYHASDGPNYRFPTGKLIGPGHMQYNLTVSEAMTDSPYATQTDWRFGVYPIIQDQRDFGGEFSGNVHIIVTAISDGAAGRGMGN